MSRNGSGTYSLPVNSWNPAVNGVPATAADWQALINDVASAITQSVSRDGQTTLTGNLPMGSNKLTGLAAGTAAGDSLRWEQLFSQGQPQDLASAAATDIGAQLTTVLNITGTTTITSFGTNYNGPRFLRFAGALTLTHGAALVLPGAANITTAAGDAAIVVPLGSPASGWRVVAYQRASGEPLTLADGSITLAKLASSAYGTSGANKLLQLDGTGKLPAVDGSQLTGLPAELPSQTGNAGKLLRTDGANPSWGAAITLGTSVNSTSGTAIDFTSIPAWVRRITVMLIGVSTKGTSALVLRVGSASIQSTGYASSVHTLQNAVAVSGGETTSGFSLTAPAIAASATHQGAITMTNISGNTWVAVIAVNRSFDVSQSIVGSGVVTLSGTLDRLRLTTSNGTDEFDAGSVNISWE